MHIIARPSIKTLENNERHMVVAEVETLSDIQWREKNKTDREGGVESCGCCLPSYHYYEIASLGGL